MEQPTRSLDELLEKEPYIYQGKEYSRKRLYKASTLRGAFIASYIIVTIVGMGAAAAWSLGFRFSMPSFITGVTEPASSVVAPTSAVTSPTEPTTPVTPSVNITADAQASSTAAMTEAASQGTAVTSVEIGTTTGTTTNITPPLDQSAVTGTSTATTPVMDVQTTATSSEPPTAASGS